MGKSLASSAAFASLYRSAASPGPAFTAFLYSITASLYFSFCAYSSPLLVCLAASSAGVLEQDKRNHPKYGGTKEPTDPTIHRAPPRNIFLQYYAWRNGLRIVRDPNFCPSPRSSERSHLAPPSMADWITRESQNAYLCFS